MIYINDKQISLIYVGGKAIATVTKGAQLVWQAVRSCFGAGYWRGDKPWVGSDAWKGNLTR